MCEKGRVSKRVFFTKILENIEIAEGVYLMKLKYPESESVKAKAGQFVNLYLNREDMLLPRPISICRIQEDMITLVYGVVGKGTAELKSYIPGAMIKVSSALGNGYNLSAGGHKQAVLVGGGIGIPPLLELSYRLMAMGVATRIILGFKNDPFLVEKFRETGGQVYVATDSGSHGFHGNVLDLIKNSEFAKVIGDVCFACGPIPMLKGLNLYLEKMEIDYQVSLEERMGCGFGSCLSCVCKISTKSGIVQRRVCKDGPVFDGRQVIWDA